MGWMVMNLNSNTLISFINLETSFFSISLWKLASLHFHQGLYMCLLLFARRVKKKNGFNYTCICCCYIGDIGEVGWSYGGLWHLNRCRRDEYY